MPQFAKLFGPESDQVLVLFDEGDEGPHVKDLLPTAGTWRVCF